ncbi:MAG TPA: adenylate/guanylate cyclase domain-containing protein [Candidatus Limnocylindrales bacterium]
MTLAGNGLEGGPPSPTAGPIASDRGPTERRLVSVLFADLVGFTGLAADRDAEAVRELLGRYFELAREVIERYGGVVEKFIGDAVMAVWGTPTAHEDDAERAVRAALDLVEAIGAIEVDPGGVRLEARAGVLTGEAAVAVGARGEGMVAGDLVNTASRLQSVAPGGRVLVGEATVRATESAIAYEEAGPQALKGKAAPVAAWLAARVVAGIGGSGRSARPEPPFVGRDDELRLLKELFHATARERRPRLVSITGIAGIGKSRLAWELEKYLDGLVEPVYWHQGRSPAYGEGLAFWALGEMVRARARIAESDDVGIARDKLHAAVDEWLADPEERGWVERRLAVLLGLEPAPDGGGEELFAAWRTLFERVSERGTTVLVFEELHWADAGLLDFVEELVAKARNRPILVVTLARPDLLDRHPTWGAGQRSFTSLDLGPLGPTDMDTLLTGLVPGLPQSAARAIRDRAEGVPLYAVETVRMLLDHGVLTETAAGYAVTGSLASLAIPDTLAGLVGARLDALRPDERELLGYAAVLGQSFTVDGLVTLGGRDEADVRRILEGLERRELVVLDDDPRSPERGQYRFVQGLLREVAHGRLSRRERLARHLAAARLYEQQEDDELAGVVASHYLDAYRAASDGRERSELGERALRALVAAAERARTLHAPGSAIGYYEGAAELAPDPVARRSLLEHAADAAIEARPPEEAVAYARTILDLVRSEPAPDHPAFARAYWRLGRSLVYSGHPAEAVRTIADAVAELGDSTADVADVRLGSELARAMLMAGEPMAALEVAERFAAPAEAIGDREVVAELLISRGWALSVAGRQHEAIAVLRGAIVLAERDAPPATRFRGAMNLTANLLTDDPRETLRIALDHYRAARRLGYEGWAESLAGNVADPALWTGEWALIEQVARDMAADEQQSIFRGGVDLSLATLRALQGRVDEAESISAAVAAMHADSEDPQVALSLRWAAMLVDVLVRGRLSSLRPSDVPEFAPLSVEAATHFWLRGALWTGQPEAVSERMPNLETPIPSLRYTRAIRLMSLAIRAALLGHTDEAEPWFAEAIELFRRLDVPLELALALMDRIAALPDADPTEAEIEARAILERLGANGLLARLDDLVARPATAPGGRAAPPPVEMAAPRSTASRAGGAG